ncbi:MAG: biliverdin-producing heme oxygenase [Pseudomonadota bacterium]
MRTHLRTGTAEIHEALHAHPWFAALAEGTLSPARYHVLMERLFGFYSSLDPVLLNAEKALRPQIGTYCYAPRTPVLRGATHGLAPGLAVPMPEVEDLAAFCGATYVVDGAVLGGAILARAMPPGADATYWTWCRIKGPAIWRAICQLLREVEGDVNPSDALDTAIATFAAFESWMDPAPHEAAA